MPMYLEIDGTPFTGFTEAHAFKTMEAASGTFTFKIAKDTPVNFPIKIGAVARVLIDSTPIINGFVEKIKPHNGADGFTYEISGRDKTCDFIDSSVPPSVEIYAGGTLKRVIEYTLKEMGLSSIKVTNNVSGIAGFRVGEILSGSIGEKGFEFVEKYCRKRQVFLTCDGNGNLVICRASKDAIKTYLLSETDGKNNNILESEAEHNINERYAKYQVYGQTNPIDGELVDIGITASAPDTDIRATRRMIFSAESTLDGYTAQQRAKWEKNIRRARGITYSCTVAGYKAESDGKIWEQNMLVNIIDDACNINSKMLIKSVDFSMTEDGETTKLTCVPPDAFTLDVEMKSAQAKTNNIMDDMEGF